MVPISHTTHIIINNYYYMFEVLTFVISLPVAYLWDGRAIGAFPPKKYAFIFLLSAYLFFIVILICFQQYIRLDIQYNLSYNLSTY